MTAAPAEAGTVRVPLERLAVLANPLASPPWPTVREPFGASRLRALADSGQVLDVPYPADEALSWSADDHARRIAWFVRHGWSAPIDIDMGVPGFWVPGWCVMDGNHRLAAAFVLGHPDIEAEVSGSVEFARELLGVAL